MYTHFRRENLKDRYLLGNLDRGGKALFKFMILNIHFSIGILLIRKDFSEGCSAAQLMELVARKGLETILGGTWDIDKQLNFTDFYNIVLLVCYTESHFDPF